MDDKPFDRLAEDGMVATRTTFYPKLREVARRHGYALALHGTLAKDLDVVAVPWVEDAADEDTLVRALVERCGGYVSAGGRRVDGEWRKVGARTEKPHGRAAWTIHLGGNGGYVDLSVMPRSVA